VFAARSVIMLPILKAGRPVAYFYAMHHEPRSWPDAERRLIREVGDRTWATVERCRAEAALRERQTTYRLIFESARDYAILTTDPEGRIETWSPGAEAVFGWTEAEIVGRPFAVTFVPEEQAAGVPAHELVVAAETGRVEREGWRVRKGGVRFWANEIATVIHDGEGRLAGFTRISRDLTERRLADAAAQRDVLRRQLSEVEEEERRRLARELHDEIGQDLTSLLLSLRTIEDAKGPDELREATSSLRELVVTALQDVRRLAVELRPKALDDFGLVPALERLAATFAEQTGMVFELEDRLGDRRLPSDVETAFYRIVQETLTNVVKHAQAQHVSILLVWREDNAKAVIEDDGLGFDPGASTEGLGLLGIRERLDLLSGRLVIESTPGAGTTLVVEIPLQ